jgi:hypothetical protein
MSSASVVQPRLVTGISHVTAPYCDLQYKCFLSSDIIVVMVRRSAHRYCEGIILRKSAPCLTERLSRSLLDDSPVDSIDVKNSIIPSKYAQRPLKSSPFSPSAWCHVLAPCRQICRGLFKSTCISHFYSWSLSLTGRSRPESCHWVLVPQVMFLGCQPLFHYQSKLQLTQSY